MPPPNDNYCPTCDHELCQCAAIEEAERAGSAVVSERVLEVAPDSEPKAESDKERVNR